jgi:2-oxoglutarate/2-oxoacid ferredoxin oxidoreductase subunit alpha
VDDIITYDEYEIEDAELFIIAYGGVARAARAAVKECRKSGHEGWVIPSHYLWPFPEKRVHELTQKSKKVLVAEMNLGQYVIPVHRVKMPDAKYFNMAR